MLFHFNVLAIVACTAGLVLGSSDGNSAMVYNCAPTHTLVCLINIIKLENPNVDFSLENVGNKKILNFKTGRIEALLPNHCRSLSNFEKVSIGSVGLKELCFATTFVEVNAERNNINKLHVEQQVGASYRVEVLRLNDNRLKSVEDICTFVALRELHLERNFLSTLDLACFKEMTNLKKLNLAYNRLNTITSTVSELKLPALDFIGLQNNTLTELDLHKWSLSALGNLDLSSNILTSVRGLERLDSLSKISLAGNRWQCNELEQMLETLENNVVQIKDGDQDCSAIRNGTICCVYEQQGTEQTLLDELNKLTELEQRYKIAETEFEHKIKQEIQQFESKIEKLKETLAKQKNPEETQNPKDASKIEDGAMPPEAVSSTETVSSTEDTTLKQEVVEDTSRKCACICSKEILDTFDKRLNKLEAEINASNVELQALLDNKPQVSYMITLTKQQFRTAVKRGEYKLKELSSMLDMLRDHIKQKQH